MTALCKQVFGMRLLEIGAADFSARNLRRDGQHRDTVAMAIIKSIDQMQVTRSTTPCAYRKASGQMRFRARRECSRFLVPDVYPLDVVSRSDGISDSVQRISGYSIDSFDSRCYKSVD